MVTVAIVTRFRLRPKLMVAMIVADGPFNVKVANISGMGRHQHAEFRFASGEMTSPEFVSVQRTVFGHLVRHSKNGAIHYLFMDWRSSLELLLAAREEYTEHKNTLVWAKTNAWMGSFYRCQHALILYLKAGQIRISARSGSGTRVVIGPTSSSRLAATLSGPDVTRIWQLTRQ